MGMLEYWMMENEALPAEAARESERLPLEMAEAVRELDEGVRLEHIGAMPSMQEFLKETDSIAGDPEEDMENWHQQSEQNSCAISCQEFVAEQLLDREFSEKEMIEHAKSRGWYDAETGTPVEDVGKLLEELGLSVEWERGLTLNDLALELDSGAKLICGVSHMVLANPEFAALPGYKADHAVEVIGIDAADASNVKVVLNDPGTEQGRGIEVPADIFADAWNASGNYAVIARKGETA